MSIRTVIEINHDYLHDLSDERFEEIKKYLRGAPPVMTDAANGRHIVPGVRVLGQRHHSETLKLTVK